MPRLFKNDEEKKAGRDVAGLTADIEAQLRKARAALDGGSKISKDTLKNLNDKFSQFGAVAVRITSW